MCQEYTTELRMDYIELAVNWSIWAIYIIQGRSEHEWRCPVSRRYDHRRVDSPWVLDVAYTTRLGYDLGSASTLGRIISNGNINPILRDCDESRLPLMTCRRLRFRGRQPARVLSTRLLIRGWGWWLSLRRPRTVARAEFREEGLHNFVGWFW